MRLLYQLRPACRRRLRARNQRRDLVEPRGEDAAERVALAPAHLDEVGKHLPKACDHRGLDGAALVLALLGVDDIDHAFDVEKPVEPRTLRIDAAGQLLDRSEDRGEHVLIDAHLSRRASPIDGERRIDGAAREHVGGLRAHRRLDGVPARRRAQPQVEPLGIDRLDLPGPGVAGGLAVGAGKPGHTRQCHGQAHDFGGRKMRRTIPMRPRRLKRR